MRSEGSAGQALGDERANGSGEGHLEGQGPVHSYDEWSPLRHVVVGRGEHFNCYHIDSSFKLFYLENVEPIIGTDSAPQRHLRLPTWVVDELCEDLEGLVDALRDYGAVVQRPVEAAQAEIVTPFWSSRATPALNIRDQTLILGDTIVETAPHVRARYFENDLLKPLFQRYFARGSNWLSMPRPALARDSLDASYYATRGFETAHLSADGGTGELKGLGHEMVFDGAQCIRLGRDVLVNVANANHQLGYEWLLRTFGEKFRFHRLAELADNHIDSVMLPLRPGLMLLRNPTFRTHLPKPLRSWKFVYPPEVTEHRFPDYGSEGLNLASRFIDMNVLSLDEDTVVVNALYPELIDTLEEEGLEVVPVRHRHRRLFSGGFHCFTLDCVRAGGAEDYLG
jgi:glycine amidinotransferase